LYVNFLPAGDLALQTEDDIAVSGKLVELWTQFALTGSPTPQDGVWTPLNRTSADQSLNYAIIDHKKVRDTAHHPEKAQVDLPAAVSGKNLL
jgi:hypothetical protein